MKLIINRNQPTIEEIPIACGSLYFIVGFDNEERIRFFFQVSHNGGGCQANLTGLAKCLTLVYNDGRLNYSRYIEELKEIVCPACKRWHGIEIGKGKNIESLSTSCPNAIAKILEHLEIVKEDKSDKK